MEDTSTFPKSFKRLIEWLCPEQYQESILGDLEEHYQLMRLENSGLRLKLIILSEVLKFLRPAILLRHRKFKNSITMGLYQNYLTTSWRNLKNNTLYSFINVLGLSTGIASSFFIALFVMDELSYDSYHHRADQVYRLVQTRDLNGTTEQTAMTSIFLGTNMQQRFTGLNNVIRFLRDETAVFEYENESFQEDQFFFVDAGVLESFRIPIVAGSGEDALDDPRGLMISQSTATKYFGDENPIGKTLLYKNFGYTNPFIISAVMEDVPSNSHIQYEIIAPFKSDYNVWYRYHGDDYYFSGAWTYLDIADHSSVDEVQSQLNQLIATEYPDDLKGGTSYSFQPLADVYLHSDLSNEIEANSDITYVYIFSAVGLMILLIAYINFINLATARATQRSKEIGLRKVIGASKKGILAQFLTEAFIITFVSLVVSGVIVAVLLTDFNQLANKNFTWQYILTPRYINAFVLIGIMTALLSGFYPALLLSRFKAVSVLKLTGSTNMRGVNMRRALVIFQFTLSMVLIVGILVVSHQLNYMNNRELGFNEDRIVYIPLGFGKNFQNALNDITSQSGVQAVSGGQVPGTTNSYVDLLYRDQTMDLSSRVTVPTGIVYYNYLDILELELESGRNFSPAFNDSRKSCIVNESFVEMMDWESPIGEILYSYNMIGTPSDTLKIVGVVKDYNFESLHNGIKPLILRSREKPSVLIAKMSSEKLFDNVTAMTEKLAKYYSDVPPEVQFLQNDLNSLYQKEVRLANIMTIFSFFAILISCLGLFGLASFTVSRKAREISIRKVLGASVNSLLSLLTSEYSRLVIISFAIAVPLCWFLFNSWLNNFAFRISLGLDVFLWALLISLSAAFLTVGYHSLRAANVNPVKALKDE
ncbi:MAG: FtsX-like permease family protein [Cyclobacteriaceae bacterium]